MYLVLSAFTSSPVSLVATTRAIVHYENENSSLKFSLIPDGYRNTNVSVRKYKRFVNGN